MSFELFQKPIKKQPDQIQVLFLKTVPHQKDTQKSCFVSYPSKVSRDRRKQSNYSVTESELNSFASVVLYQGEDISVPALIDNTFINFSFMIAEEYDQYYGCGSNIRYVVLICIVYDITDPETFKLVESYEDTIRCRGRKKIIIVGMNSHRPRKVPYEAGADLAARFGHPFIEVSTHTGHNMIKLFELILLQLLDPQCPGDYWSDNNSTLLQDMYGVPEGDQEQLQIIYKRVSGNLRVYFSKWNYIGWLVCLRVLYEEGRATMIEGKSDEIVMRILKFHKDLFGAFIRNYFWVVVRDRN